MNDSGRLLAGEVGKPHGIRGEVYVIAISDDPRRFDPDALLMHDSGAELRVETSRRHGPRLLVKFAGVDDRTAAEGLRGALYISPDQRRKLDEDEYWEEELIGMTALAAGGDVLGEVGDILPGAAQDLMAVETPSGRRLVPMVAEFIVLIDRVARTVVIDAPQGLFD